MKTDTASPPARRRVIAGVAALHASAFRERCRQVVHEGTAHDHARDQVLALAIDHACQSCEELDGLRPLEEHHHVR